MVGLRRDCVLVVHENKTYIKLKQYFIPLPWHIAFIFSFLNGKWSLEEVVNIVINIGLMSEVKKNKLLYEIKVSYTVFLEEYPLGAIRTDIIPPEEILKLSKEKISIFDYPIPRAMLYHVTSSCDKFCKYCYLETKKGIIENDILEKEEVFRILDDMRDMAIPKIIYTGGEPFLHPNFMEILEYASKKGIYSSVTTKHYFTEDEAVKIGKMGMVKIALSYDTHIPHEADFLSGKKNHAEKMNRSIKYLVNNNVDISIELVVTGINIGSIEVFLVHLKKLGVTEVELHRYVNTENEYENLLNITEEQWNSVIELLNQQNESMPNICLYNESIEIFSEGEENLETGCVNGIASFSMLPDGRVVLCDHMPNAEDYCYGNLRIQTIEEIWHDERRFDIIFPKRSEFANSPCESCNDFLRCLKKTACRKQSLLQHGNINSPSLLTIKLCDKFR